ncbi:hypothetical protein JOY44_12690 [Phormidium sp. CLA17]|uniref:hypothetical protein n=1 Tax=Leptolyngbya sp. Cla-17 TaxID=2803751 RepID=UPI001491949E|nr:hypothetical protein [Leptolyngbya sp. Cla-17]MBM0742462.1 hypothetical protein [Leptolyngbya sp. Cla-17]
MPAIFKLSPLIRVTLLGLYVALTVPLPLLPQTDGVAVSPKWLWFGIGLGFIALYGALSERVIVTETEIQVTYPAWMPRILRKGWVLPWAEVKALKPRSTGQGGIVYYFLSQAEQAYLLPMRVAGFSRLVRLVQERTGIDTSDVRSLSQPWMYLTLLGLTLLLLLVDSWTIWTALSLMA